MAKNNKTSNCLILVTHKFDEPLIRYLNYIKKESVDVMDIIVLYDISSLKFPPSIDGIKISLFESKMVKNFFHQGNKLLPCTLIALINSMNNIIYDHYLVMECDLVYNGNFRSFITKINSIDADYIHIASDNIGGPDKHWPIKYIRNNPFKQLYFSWAHLYYISRKFLEDVSEFIKENDTITYEFLLPTMAYNGNYIIRQFENFGYKFDLSWGPAEIFEYKYQNERVFNTFYHPIKNLDIIDYEHT